MRILAFALVLLGLPAAVIAAPVHRLGGFNADLVQRDEPRLRIPAQTVHGSAPQDGDLLIFGLHKAPETDASAASGISFGPIHAESETINGRRHVHYHVDGLTLMGGEIGGSVSRHGAILTLHWTSSGD